jgi:hypothetical protein
MVAKKVTEQVPKKVTENAVAEAITASLVEKHDGAEEVDTNNFPAAIQEIGEAIFERYPEKTGILSSENILGMIRCKSLNDYMQETTGVRYTVLDSIVLQTESRRLSLNGKGINLFIDAIHGIQASFDNASQGLVDKFARR